MKLIKACVLVTLFVLVSWGRTTHAQSPEEEFVVFGEFLDGIATADLREYLSRPGAQVKGQESFEEMRRHILSMYDEIEVEHSFFLDSQVFDCIPIEKQPSVRLLDLKKIVLDSPEPALPGKPLSDDPVPGQAEPATSPLLLGLVDTFGNEVRCDEGTIPMRRITLDELVRFGTLQRFFQKGPDGSGRPPRLDEPPRPTSVSHKYAHAYQSVNNHGGNSWLNLWSPAINTSTGQIFSLAQHTAARPSARLPGRPWEVANLLIKVGSKQPIRERFFI